MEPIIGQLSTSLPHIATLEAQKDTDLVTIVKVAANENAPRDTETMVTVTDLPLINTNYPARSTTATTTKKTRKNVGDRRERQECEKDRKKHDNLPEKLLSTHDQALMREGSHQGGDVGGDFRDVQVPTIANTDPGMTTAHYPFQIIS